MDEARPSPGAAPVVPPWQELAERCSALLAEHGDPERHPVAAAIRATDGTRTVGLATYHFTGGLCAELVALANLRMATRAAADLLCVVGDANRGLMAPCGRCRQVFVDIAPGISVAIATPQGVSLTSIEDLMPHAYKPRRRLVVPANDVSKGAS